MSNLEDFKALEEKLMGIDNQLVGSPNIPVDVAAQEAEDLYHCSKKDAEKLQTAGLNVSLIDSLPQRVGTLRHTQSLWMKEYNSKEESIEEWKELSPIVYDLRDELVHYFNFAFRKDAKLKAQVERIAKGYGHADMIQDLSDLAVLGKSNTGLLEVAGLDLIKLDTAQGYSDSLAELLAVVNGERAVGEKPAKDMRDRAFTYMKQAVDEIRETGKFVFWKDDKKVLQYSSKYYRNQYKKKKKETVS